MAALCALAILGCIRIADADISLPSSPPPQPLAQTTQVQIGGTVEIPLRGVSRSGQQLSFLVRSSPALGALSEVSIRDRLSATVLYHHDAARGAGVDRFRYAVQVPGSGVSTPAEVIIRVVDKPSRFEAPTTMEFASVAAGKTRTKVAVLRNDGGGIVRGRMDLPEPWVFTDGDGSYSIGEGEMVEIALTFSPQIPGVFNGVASFSHASTRKLSLSGEAFAAIEAVAGSLEFRIGEDGQQRRAELRLKNRTNEPKRVDVNAPPELGGSREVRIGGQEEVAIILRSEPEFLKPLAGDITIVGEGVDISLPFRMFASPALLEIKGKEAWVDFGSVMQRRSMRATISVRNSGGSDAMLRGNVPEEISVAPSITGEPLAPGETRTFELTFTSAEPQTFNRELKIFDGAGSAVSWSVMAVVEPDPRLAAGPVVRLPLAGPGESSIPGARPQGPQTQIAFPPVEEIRMTYRSKQEIHVEWDNPAPEVVQFHALERRIDFTPTGQMNIVWEPIKNATMTVGEKETSLEIRNLRPGQRITLGVIGLDSAGRATMPSPPFIFDSEHSKPIYIPWIPICAILFIACVVVLVRERRRQRSELESKVQEISRWR